MWSIAVLGPVNIMSLRKDTPDSGEGKAGLKEKLSQKAESVCSGIGISWAALGRAALSERTAVSTQDGG